MFQVPAILKAQELGLKVYTCGNIPADPGHAISDGYHPVSTTDKVAVLALARELDVQGVSAYASDPAAETAAYVAERMGLPGDPFEATKRVQDKVYFRAVQAQLGIAAPEAFLCADATSIASALQRWPNGGIIKPVDASGSKGVHRMLPGMDEATLQGCFADALANSRSRRVICEEFLRKVGPQMTGDVLVHEGRIKASCWGDVHFDARVNGLVPCGVTVPGTISQEHIDHVLGDLQRIITHLGLRQGGYNIDIFTDEAGRPIIVDMGTRNGGNMLNTLYQRRIGIDMMELTIRMSMGDPGIVIDPRPAERFVSHLVLHSAKAGVLRSVTLSERIAPFVFHSIRTVHPGDRVEPFTGASKRLGLLLLEFPDMATMQDIYAHLDEHVVVDLVGNAAALPR